MFTRPLNVSRGQRVAHPAEQGPEIDPVFVSVDEDGVPFFPPRDRTPFQILRGLAEGEERRWKLVVDARVVAIFADSEGVHVRDCHTGDVKTVQPQAIGGRVQEFESASRGLAQLDWPRKRKEVEPDNRARLWNLGFTSRGECAARQNEELADE